MGDVIDAVAEQHAELTDLLAPLAEADWERPTPRCPGWVIGDVVLHIAQTDELALGSIEGRFPEVAAELMGGAPAGATGTVDDGVDRMVAAQRGRPGAEVRDRWQRAADDLVRALRGADPHLRVQWVAGQLSVRTLAATRLSECWIHTGDIADALGVDLPPAGDRLVHLARLAWRTIPYAFARDGRELHGGVAFHLTAPSGNPWDFVPDGDEPPLTTITGDGVELVEVAARRRLPAETSLRCEGPDGHAVLDLVRTYA